jgi:hypothetical protein
MCAVFVSTIITIFLCFQLCTIRLEQQQSVRAMQCRERESESFLLPQNMWTEEKNTYTFSEETLLNDSHYEQK